MSNYKNIINIIEKRYNKDPSYNMDEEEVTELFKMSIINDDIELIELLINKNVIINESILEILPFSGEVKFLLISNYIVNNLPHFNWGDHSEFIEKLIKSNSSTSNMWDFLINKLNWAIPEKINGIPLLFFICLYKKENILFWFLSNKKVDLFQKYLNKNLLNYIEERLSPQTYLKIINDYM